MIRPGLQSHPLFSSVSGAIVDTGDFSPGPAADMVNHCLDDVRLDAQFVHAGDYGAPQVVQCPWC